MEIIIDILLYLNDKRKQRFKKSKIPLMLITNNDISMCPICYNYQVNTVFYLVHMLLVTYAQK